MPVTRIILILILVYFIYRGIKYLLNLLKDAGNLGKQYTNQTKGRKAKSSIDKKDIIDAEFEDIDESEKSR